MYGIDGERELTEQHARPPDRLRGRPAGAHRQRRVRTRRQHDVWGALLDSVYLHTKSRDQLAERIWPILKRQVERGDRALAGAGPRHLGGARRAEALHLLEGHVLGGARPRRAAGAACARSRSSPTRWQTIADEIHADICDNGVDDRGVFMPALRDRRAGRLGAADAAGAVPAAGRPADPRHRAGDRRRADRRRPGAALPRRGDRRRAAPARRARSRSARSGWSRR